MTLNYFLFTFNLHSIYPLIMNHDISIFTINLIIPSFHYDRLINEINDDFILKEISYYQ